MDQPPHERLCEIFEGATSLAGTDQQEYLDHACGDDAELRAMVDKMLLADSAESGGGLGAALVGELADELAAPPMPLRIGPYRIHRKIGMGGMGIVYEAEQDKPRRSVALKVMRRGADEKQVARFSLEAEVLGWLQHPYIAHVYGAGTTLTDSGPLPWISMELIDGLPLDAYQETNSPTLEGKVELIVKILEGVSHAHNKGVVHRDLKPGNVLVDQRGQPHIVDFGVARILEGTARGWDGETKTQPGDVIGTLSYMSPEQVSGDPAMVTTQSDIYSVGTIAFQMLSGELPLDLRGKSLTQAIDTIRKGRQRSLKKEFGLPHDLDSIIRKAREAAPDQRYQSAQAFAEDLRRFQKSEAILARPPSALYQLKCFGRRNKALSLAMATALAAIIGGGAFSTYRFVKEQEANTKAALALQEASDARDDALKQSELSERGLQFYGGLLTSSSHNAKGQNWTVADMVEQAAEQVPVIFPDAPQQQAHLLLTFSIANFNAGRTQQALDIVEQVVRIIEDTPLDGPMFANAAHMQHSVALQSANRGPEAIEAAKKAVAVVAGKANEKERWGHARAVERLALRYSRTGDYESALEVLEPVIQDVDTFDGRPGFRGSLVMVKARMLLGLARYEEATSLARKAYAFFEEDDLGAGPLGIDAHLTLGIALVRSGKPEEALETLVPLAGAERAVNGPSGRLMYILRMTAECHASQRRHQDAIRIYTEAIESLGEVTQRPHIMSANCWIDMGKSQNALGDTDQAIASFRRGIEDLEGANNTAQWVRRSSGRTLLAMALRKSGDLGSALASVDASREDLDACNTRVKNPSDLFVVMHLRSTILFELQRWKAAEESYIETLELGLETKVSQGQWSNVTGSMKKIRADHPGELEGNGEDVERLIQAVQSATQGG